MRTRGGGHTTQIITIRRAIARGIVVFYQKYKDESSKREIKQKFLHFDRSLLVVDARRCKPKKFKGPGACARYQKSYRRPYFNYQKGI